MGRGTWRRDSNLLIYNRSSLCRICTWKQGDFGSDRIALECSWPSPCIFAADRFIRHNHRTLHIISTLFNVHASSNCLVDKNEPMQSMYLGNNKATVARWGHLNKTIVSGHEDGTIKCWDAVVTFHIFSWSINAACVVWRSPAHY